MPKFQLFTACDPHSSLGLGCGHDEKIVGSPAAAGKKWLGMEPRYHAIGHGRECLGGHEIHSTWVFDQNPEGKFFQIE